MTSTDGSTPGDRFTPVPGLVLSEPFDGSGYVDPPHLARLPGGQVIQLTPLLYQIAAAMNGDRDSAAIARIVRDRTGRDEVTAGDVRHLVDGHLRPLGIATGDDPERDAPERFDPLTSLVARRDVISPTWVRRLARPFVPLFWWPFAVLVVVGFLAVQVWAVGAAGLTDSLRDALADPANFVVAFGLTVASAAFHEFGHAAALLRGGKAPGAMGAGIHLVWPAFYTDVTDAYLLPRRDRLRVDIGGIYFNMIFTVLLFGAYLATGAQLLVLIIVLQLFQAGQQLLPFTRLDGYYLVSDLVGVPDLYLRMPDILRSLAPGTEPSARVKALKPWARRAVTAWVVASALFGVAIVGVVLTSFTTVAGDALARVTETGGAAWRAAGDGQLGAALANALRAGTAAILPIGFVLILARLGRRLVKAVRLRVDDRRREQRTEQRLAEELDDDERSRLMATARSSRAQSWARERARIGLTTALGWSADRIADRLELRQEEVRYWQCRFRRYGVAALERAPGVHASLGARHSFLDLLEQRSSELYALARQTDLAGRSDLSKVELAAALVAQNEPVPVDKTWVRLWSLSRDELYALARRHQIPGRSSMDKTELVQALAPPAEIDQCDCAAVADDPLAEQDAHFLRPVREAT